MSIILKSKNIETLIFILIFILTSNSSFAVPANPAANQVTQPDGSKLDVRAKGDEFQGWLETLDGYSIIKNPQNNRFEYANLDALGKFVPSHIEASTFRLLGLGAPGLRPPKGLHPLRNIEYEKTLDMSLLKLETIRLKRIPPRAPNRPGQPPAPVVTGTWAPAPVIGERKLLLVLVNFQDVKITKDGPAYWSSLMFDPTQHSVAQFYKDNSYGKVKIVPVPHSQLDFPTGVVSVTLNRDNPNYGNQYDYATESAIINEALNAASPFVDFSSLDINNDNEISVDEALIYFVYAGYEAAAGSGLEPSVWAHRWNGPNVAVAGKRVANWALNGELYDANTRMQMGVVAHEMGHAMGGLPDLYDTSNTNSGIGAFSVMGTGAWGAASSSEIPGQTPVGFDAWSRHYVGWSTPRFQSTPDSRIDLDSGSQDPKSAILLLNPKLSTSEYWMAENRVPTGWDAGLLQLLGADTKGGILIQHIDANVGNQGANSFNLFVSGSHQGNVVVEPSTATCDLLNGESSSGCQTIFYYSGNSIDLNDQSNPSTKYYSGKSSGLGLKILSPPSPTMSVEVKTP